ncbi:HNH endonuclease [Agrobacterium sp. CG674]
MDNESRYQAAVKAGRKIPEPIKREVRRRCRFGCVICGMPFFEYDHLVEYSVCREHVASNIILLCPEHHRKKTSGKTVLAFVAEMASSPRNTRFATTSPFQLDPARALSVNVGSIVVERIWWKESEAPVLWNTGNTFLCLHNENGWLSVSGYFTDESGNHILTLDHGEIKVSTGVWDFTYEGTNIKIRHSLGNIALDVDVSNECFELRKGSFLNHQGSGFIAGPDGLRVMKNRSMVTTFKNQTVASAFGVLIFNDGAHFPVNRVPSHDFALAFGDVPD